MNQYNQIKPDGLNYKIGDVVVSKSWPNIELGICTGFTHNNTCILIDGKCYGGASYFMKSEFIDCIVIN